MNAPNICWAFHPFDFVISIYKNCWQNYLMYVAERLKYGLCCCTQRMQSPTPGWVDTQRNKKRSVLINKCNFDETNSHHPPTPLLHIGPVLDRSRPVPTRSWKSWLALDQDRTTLGPCPDQTVVPCNLVRSRSGPGLGPVPLGTVTSLGHRGCP